MGKEVLAPPTMVFTIGHSTRPLPTFVELLKAHGVKRLVDVRTDAEWNFVGIPDLSPVGQEPVLIPWQVYPTMQVNAAFTEHMRRAGLEGRTSVPSACIAAAYSVESIRLPNSPGALRTTVNVPLTSGMPLDRTVRL